MEQQFSPAQYTRGIWQPYRVANSLATCCGRLCRAVLQLNESRPMAPRFISTAYDANGLDVVSYHVLFICALVPVFVFNHRLSVFCIVKCPARSPPTKLIFMGVCLNALSPNSGPQVCKRFVTR